MAKKSWSLSYTKAVSHLASEEIACFEESPLHDVPAQAKKWTWKKLTKAQAESLLVVARPKYILGMLLSPPFGRGGLWFYGRGEELVGCLNHEEKKELSFVEVTLAGLTEHVFTCLDLELPLPSYELELSLSQEAFLSLVGLVDANRVLGLRSLLEHQPEPERSFSERAVLTALANGQQSRDERWMSAIIEHVFPFPFSLNPDSAEKGLKELRKAGLVKRSKGEWVMTRKLQILYPHLATPVGYASLYGHPADPEQMKSFTGIRTSSGLWSIESDGSKLQFASRDDREMVALLADLVPRWRAEFKKRKPKPSGSRCKCGAGLPKGAKFCPDCGSQVSTTKGPRKKPTHCHDCGEKLRDQALFCTKCGVKVDS